MTQTANSKSKELKINPEQTADSSVDIYDEDFEPDEGLSPAQDSGAECHK